MAAVLEDQFNRAAEFVRDMRPARPVSDGDKLKAYGLYKQASEGNVNCGRPMFWDFQACAKWDAWHAVRGKPRDDAQREYIAEVERQKAQYM